MITYKTDKTFNQNKLKTLYESVEWFAYTSDFDKLSKAVENSLYVMSAWDDDRLVGLIRAVGDQETILYIQDILVNPEYQNQGIASHLLNECLDMYKHVRQKVLLTDNTTKNKSFYLKNNFTKCGNDLIVFYRQF